MCFSAVKYAAFLGILRVDSGESSFVWVCSLSQLANPPSTRLAKVQFMYFCDYLKTGLRLLEWNNNLVCLNLDPFKGM